MSRGGQTTTTTTTKERGGQKKVLLRSRQNAKRAFHLNGENIK